GLAPEGDRREIAGNYRLGAPGDRSWRALHRALNALEHRLHVGIGIHHAQQAGRFVMFYERLGLRLEDLQPLADHFLFVVRPLDHRRTVAALATMRRRAGGRRIYIEHEAANLADSAPAEPLEQDVHVEI